MEKLRTWYLDKEEDVRLLVAQLLYKMTNTATDTLRTVYTAVIPLALYGGHYILHTLYVIIIIMYNVCNI
jgi:hypothetical protein